MDFTPAPHLKSDKKAWRASFRAARTALSGPDKHHNSAQIVARLLALPEIEAASIIHTFWPLLATGEVDIRPFIHAVNEAGKQVALPVVLSYETGPSDRSRMEHRRFTTETKLAANRWGIYEPVRGAVVAPAAFEVVIVPALGVDRRGRRIGYGKGYYDELLAETKCPTICPIWASCLTESKLPADPHDKPVDIIVTAAETVYTNRPVVT